MKQPQQNNHSKITELLTYQGYPHWLTRKDAGEETVLTMQHDKPINVGDGFTFYLKPNKRLDENGKPIVDVQSINYLKVVEVIEQRKSKGVFKDFETPDHFKLRCVWEKGKVDINAINFSTGYAQN